MKYIFFVFGYTSSLLLPAQNALPVSDSSASNKSIHFIPASFSNKFSLNINPVLTIKTGDTVLTETIDAMGFDKKGIKRQSGGNPLTGPFYIEDAATGDVLAVTLTKISLNRPYAYTTEHFVSRSLPKSITGKFKKSHLIKWNLDIQNGFATPDSAYEHLQNYKVPLKPFLGCIGVAPSNSKNEILSFFPGPFGGNLDFSSLSQGSTIYLPVFHDGAYLYIGDAHALQGDGELTGNALETSMDFSLVTKVIKSSELRLNFPRFEDVEHIMAIATAKTLEEALKLATLGLLEWIQKDYGLALNEATQVLGPLIEYRIPTLAGPKVEIVAMIKKENLKGLTKTK